MPLKSPLIILYICLYTYINKYIKYIYIYILLHSVHTILKYPQDTKKWLNAYASIIPSFSTCKTYMIKAVNSKKRKNNHGEFGFHDVVFSCSPLGPFLAYRHIQNNLRCHAASFHPQGRHSPDQPGSFDHKRNKNKDIACRCMNPKKNI